MQPIGKISEICRRRSVLLHTDAAQTAGKLSTRVDDLGVDLLTVARHKVYAPKGVGVLYVRRGVTLEPVLHGAGHEANLRACTENVPYIVGLGRAASLAEQSLVEAGDRLTALRDRLLDKLREAIGLEPEIARGTVRLSIGWYTDADQIDRAAQLLIAAWENSR